MRKSNKLTPRTVSSLDEVGRYADGGGLYLQVAKSPERGRTTKAWIFRYMLDGRARHMGLGSIDDFTLAEARERARKARQQIADGIDPIQVKQDQRTARLLERAKQMTFQECAEAYMAAKGGKWTNERHRKQWSATLTTYAYPVIGKLPVGDVDTALVEKVLRPVFERVPETARRLRSRIEMVLSWATVAGYRKGDNPARWKDHLSHVLPESNHGHKHWPALPYDQVGEFMFELRNREGLSPRALELTILTGVRTNEMLGAKWSEFDLKKKLWTVPRERTKGKAGKKYEHIVPLSNVAMAILTKLSEQRIGDYVFPGAKKGGPISNMAMAMIVRRMNEERSKAGLSKFIDPKEDNREIVPHGFRSTFSDWVGDRSNFDRETREFAIGHAITDKTVAAYRRGTAVEKRRKLMDAWAGYCTRAPAAGDNVLSLGAARHDAG
jgi:integrase